MISNLEDYYNEKFGFEQNNVKIPDSMDELIDNAFEQINFTMNDESIKKTRKLLTLEQFRNKKIAKIAHSELTYWNDDEDDFMIIEFHINILKSILHFLQKIF